MSRRLRRSARRLRFEPLEERRLLAAFAVLNTEDSGEGSLRQAILDANASPDGGIITFIIPESDPNFIDVDSALPGGDPGQDVWRIQPLTELPALSHPTASIVIDGILQTDQWNAFGPAIVLDGNGLFARGLVITSGDHVVKGLNIQRFGRNGIYIDGGDRNTIVGNYIGVNATGLVAAGNERHGIGLENGASGNVIGTNGDGIDDDKEWNLIGGNGFSGVGIFDSGSDGNVVAGNYIGMNSAGTAVFGNVNRGVDIAGGPKNTRIGTNGDGMSDAVEGNVISGNLWEGVGISGAGTSQNVVAGNRIGTDATGKVDVGNALRGVVVFISASLNVIGGNQPVLRNIISGNELHGVNITSGAFQNTVAGNFIGTDITGTVGLPNLLSGVRMAGGATGNIVGTNSDGVADELEGNLISANVEYGVQMQDAGTANNTVAGNLIGTDVTGTLDLGNTLRGVAVEDGAGSARIGGTSVAARNIISGNGTGGVRITGTGDPAIGSVVIGNYIGTDLTGSLAIANNGFGILMEPGSPGNRIGTDGDGQNDAAEGNLISGNNNSGVRMFGLGTDGNIVGGNRIGTNAAGTAAISNNGHGVSIGQGAMENRIGTNGDGVSDTLERNLLSGNLSRGVLISDVGTEYNVVAGNYIGTNATATAAVGNTFDGVLIQAGASYALIGTNGDGQSDEAERNIISGNLGAGVNMINDGTSLNVVAGNSIGTDAAGALDLGNGTDGVRVQMSAQSNRTVGNTIAFNKRIGVSLSSSAGFANGISGNSIYSNALLGIDLGADGVTPNDAGDADEGPNRTLNTPTIDEILVGQSAIRATYSVPTNQQTAFFPLRVEFFLADADGQEGKTLLGTDVFTVADLAVGAKTVIFSPPSPVTADDVIVAAASEGTGLFVGNSSEFSAGHVVVTNPWHIDCDQLLDVTGDCGAFAEDALEVINYLNAFGAGPVPVFASGPPYYDTNNDFFVTAADALDIINFLNAFGAGPVPEPEASGQAAVDAVFSSLDVSQSLASTAAAEAIFAADDCSDPLVSARPRRSRRS